MKQLTDEQRERAIRRYADLMQADKDDHDLARYWWSQMKNLIDGRSAAQIARMEREQGLRAA